MLELKEIVKDYVAGDTTVKALKGISIVVKQHCLILLVV